MPIISAAPQAKGGGLHSSAKVGDDMSKMLKAKGLGTK
jgi:hypothetical protein